MTVMQAKEIRVNFILSLAFTLVGLALWSFGLAAQVQGWFLPEYVKTTRGCGGAILLVGLIWLMLTSIRPLPALRNLLYAGIVSILSLLLYMFGSWLKADYASYLKDGGPTVLVVSLIWVFISLIKLMLVPAPKATR